MSPGDEFPMHKQLGQEKLVYVEEGTVQVHLGDQERDLHPGGTVFISANTWVDQRIRSRHRQRGVRIFSTWLRELRAVRLCAAKPKGHASLDSGTQSVQSPRACGLQRRAIGILLIAKLRRLDILLANYNFMSLGELIASRGELARRKI